MSFLDRLGEVLFWPLALAEKREARRRAEERAGIDRSIARVDAGLAYKAAMSQASQAHGEDGNRMATLARRSLARGDALMRGVGLRPEEHPWRAGAVQRMAERGIAEPEDAP